MNKNLTTLFFCVFALCLGISYAEESGKKMILREAQEMSGISVAIEAYLEGNILEAKVYARMYGTKPKIYNLILVGPKLDRLSAYSKETLYPKAEETDADLSFPTSKMDRGIISFSKTKDKRSQGALTRELYRFKVPVDKIMPGRRYELRAMIEAMNVSGPPTNFKFMLNDFAAEFSQNTQK